MPLVCSSNLWANWLVLSFLIVSIVAFFPIYYYFTKNVNNKIVSKREKDAIGLKRKKICIKYFSILAFVLGGIMPIIIQNDTFSIILIIVILLIAWIYSYFFIILNLLPKNIQDKDSFNKNGD